MKKKTFLKGPKLGSKIFVKHFFLIKGTHKRGCAESAPFWKKNKIYNRYPPCKSPFLSTPNTLKT
jgi:hypothetical protein